MSTLIYNFKRTYTKGLHNTPRWRSASQPRTKYSVPHQQFAELNEVLEAKLGYSFLERKKVGEAGRKHCGEGSLGRVAWRRRRAVAAQPAPGAAVA